MFWLANLQKMNFMLDIVTKWGKCYYKMGSFLFYKTGQVVLQSRVGITEWHNFYYKMGGGSIPKWGNHYKEEQDSTKGFWHLSFRATIPESKTIVITKSCMEVWYQTMDIVQSSRFFKKTQSIQNRWKSSSIVIQFYALESWLLTPMCNLNLTYQFQVADIFILVSFQAFRKCWNT